MTFFKSNRFLTFGLTAIMSAFAAQSAMAYSTWGISLVGIGNTQINGYIGALDQMNVNDFSQAHSSTNTSFTGLDSNNNTQTMNFMATNTAQSNFGQMHLLASASLTNSYYNASNPIAYNSNTNVFDPNGSPDFLCSLGFAGFNDTLHYGGALQAGYKARYIFHVDGTNTGTGAVADLSVNIAGHDESFFAFDPGSINTNWVTQDYDINGVDPQTINVQFSNQVVFNAFELTDGSNVSGESNFSSTLTLAAIEVVDANGNQVSGYTLESDSGTHYNAIGSVPEPGSVLAITVGAFGLIARRRKAAKA